MNTNGEELDGLEELKREKKRVGAVTVFGGKRKNLRWKKQTVSFDSQDEGGDGGG